MLKIGWKAGPEQYPPKELLDFTILAERSGFDFIDVSDHFHPWSEEGEACFTWSWLGAAAVQTDKITLGTGLTCPILRYHPSVIAQAASTISHFAPNRFFLGVGTGEALNEYSSVGKWPPYSERKKMMIEAIQLIRKLFSREKVSFNGEFYQTKQAKLYTAPKSEIPIYVSSVVPNSAKMAGKYGDGLITVGGSDIGKFKRIIENFDSAAAKEGKNPDDMPKLIELGVAFTDDVEQVVKFRKKYWAGAFLPAVYNRKLYTPEMCEENGAILGKEIIKENLCISSNPEVHFSFIKKYIDLGFTHIVVHFSGPNQAEFLKRYGSEVLPLIREKYKIPMQKEYF